MVERGEIWWHEPPAAKRRPYLVLTRDSAIGVLGSVVAVPATRVIRGIPTEVVLGPDDDMPVECALSLDNISVVRKSMLVDRITRLSDSRMRDVCEALTFSVDC